VPNVILQNLVIRLPAPVPRRSFFRRSGTGGSDTQPYTTILNDISLCIKPGERVGLIGHNGAGKSTFLRALAGVYPAAHGRLEVTGTVRSLFSLHAGLDSDASARRNIYLIGLAQGIPYRKLRQREDEIIQFSGLEEVIDRPIRTFSNGMAMRLAYSATTSDSAEIMLIDEIVGTGDMEFQSRSIARTMELVEKAGLLVVASHDNAFLSNICSRGLVFDRGRIVFDGAIDDAINSYVNKSY